MSAPVIVSVSPTNNATSVLIGVYPVVTFDQLIDTSTITDSTFSLMGPGQTAVVTPEQLISPDVTPVTGREYITGTFTFATVSGATVVTFKPSKPLQPNQTYTILVVGGTASVLGDSVKNLSAEAMADNYQWSFTTGVLDTITPPPQSPLPDAFPFIDPNDIVLIPRPIVGNDLSQEIDIVFPDDIDPTSFDIQDVLLSIEAVLGDPNVAVPPGLVATATVVGNAIKVSITGW